MEPEGDNDTSNSWSLWDNPEKLGKSKEELRLSRPQYYWDQLEHLGNFPPHGLEWK